MSWHVCAKIKFHSAHSRVCGDLFFVNTKWLPVTDYSRAHSEIRYFQYFSLYFIKKYSQWVLAARLGQLQQLLKTRVKLILNSTRPHAITYTNSMQKEDLCIARKPIKKLANFTSHHNHYVLCNLVCN